MSGAPEWNPHERDPKSAIAKRASPKGAYALYAIALRISIDQLFGPLALGTAARLHPVLVIFCFLSGALLFGVVGVIMAVPVALTVKITLALLYDEPPMAALSD